MSELRVRIEGVGAWLRGVPDWNTLRAILRDEIGLREDAPSKPAASALPPAERRRAPEAVLLAAEVAGQACGQANREPSSMPCVFASTHGELSITDYMCATLANAPRELSPTKFHNSVHNAPVGYWTIATHCGHASNAVTGWHASFGAGLLEAAALAKSENTPVLFAAYDTASVGPLAEMTRTTQPFGAAFVLAPAIDSNTPSIALRLRSGSGFDLLPLQQSLRELATDNPLNAHALAFLRVLAQDSPARLTVPAASGLLLDMEVRD
ncbi:MAG TPA: beta-ketoacyl synthase chain length factor [Rhodanobacteraceae bacterium]|nr:beta-ketoacyl synthase chain length factor [Rhodanobacteraceae bacterium]